MKSKPTPRKCSLCLKPGHRSDSCPDNPTPARRARASGSGSGSSLGPLVYDLQSLKGAVAGVVEALERVLEAAEITVVVEPGRRPARASLCDSCRRAWERRKQQLLGPEPTVHIHWNVTFSTGSSTTSG